MNNIDGNKQVKQTKNVKREGVGTGTTSLLMIFTVLCFATLAMLSISTVSSNQKIQQKAVLHTQRLAKAKGEAQEKIAMVDEMLFELKQNMQKETEEITFLNAAKEEASKLGCEMDTEARTLIFSVEIDDKSELLTTLMVNNPQDESRFFIKTQASRLTNEWVPEAQGQVWQFKENEE